MNTKTKVRARNFNHTKDGTNDLLVSNVVRTNEQQVWFLAEHLVDVPEVIAD